MTPEQLVPTLETCKALKEAGYVQNAYFAWIREAEEKQFNRNVSEGWEALDYRMYARNEPISEIVAAPTLQELFACNDEIRARTAEAAALLWLELQKEQA